MKSTLAIDPGIRGCGCALFHDSKLAEAAYIKNLATKGNGLQEVRDMVDAIRNWRNPFVTDEIVVEQPCIYAHENFGRKDPNDLLPLRAIGGGLAVRYYESKVTQYLPPEWKNNMPKGEAFERRVMDRLSDSERENIQKCSGSLMHNIYDAIGLGLFHLGRFKPTRKIFR